MIHNKEAIEYFNNIKEFRTIQNRITESEQNKIKLPAFKNIGEWSYNFVQKDNSIFGIWRRCKKQDFFQEHKIWEDLIDTEKLYNEEGIIWIFGGSQVSYFQEDYFFIFLSKEGSDEKETRVFSVCEKTFVNNVFDIPYSKSEVCWYNESEALVAVNDKQTESLSSYPTQLWLFKNGDSPITAKLILELPKDYLGIWVFGTNLVNTSIISAEKTFYQRQYFLYHKENLIPIDLPNDAQYLSVMNNFLFFQLKSDWSNFEQNDVLYISIEDVCQQKNSLNKALSLNKNESLRFVHFTKNHMLCHILRDVQASIQIFQYQNQQWHLADEICTPINSTTYPCFSSADDDVFYYYVESYLQPLSVIEYNNKVISVKFTNHIVENIENYCTEQYFALSKDGTKTPYSIFYKKGNEIKPCPTIIYVYGGFEVSLTPTYSENRIKNWIDQGGVFAVANIRGGGEYGVKWHHTGIKQHKQNALNDLHAVAEDLIQKNITDKDKIGIYGGSNGGMTVCSACIQRPDLYKAVISINGVIDMCHFHEYPAGYSVIDEYGNPDNEKDLIYLKQIDPISNAKAAVEYPTVLMIAAQNDDRVCIENSRKFYNVLKELNQKVLLYEFPNGGHEMRLAPEDYILMESYFYAFFVNELR